MRTEKLNAIKGAIKDGKTVQAAGGIAVTMQQSDKLGYDWKVYSVNDVVVRKEYIAQTVPVGTIPSTTPMVCRSSITPITGWTARSRFIWTAGSTGRPKS